MSKDIVNLILGAAGNVMDVLHDEHQELPNEYTKGELEGARKTYKAILDVLNNPAPEKQDSALFTDPPVNTHTGQMIKHGNSSEYVDEPPVIMKEPQGIKNLNQKSKGIIGSSHEETVEWLLAHISGTLDELLAHKTGIRITQDNPFKSHVSEEELKEMDEASRKKEALDEISRLGQEIGDGPDPKDHKRLDEFEEEKKPVKWDQSFGKRMQDIQEEEPVSPVDNEYLDIETGEMVRERTFGRVVVDEDAEDAPATNFDEWARRKEAEEKKSNEEWEKESQLNPSRPYTFNDSGFNELEDVNPGE